MQKVVEVRVILDDVRSSHNVGSIFRTSDALGVSHIYLAGYTPAPKDTFGKINKEIAKVALGAEQTISWESVKTISRIIKKLTADGFKIVSLEQAENAKDYKKFILSQPTAFIFGNEVVGVSKKTLALCDEVLEIPMRGRKESLNVSVSFGIVLARIMDL